MEKSPLPKISSFSSRHAWENACWQKLVKSSNLLEIITTARERHDFVIRAAVRDLLHAGAGQRRISRELSVSLQTISAVSKAMCEKSYRSYWERSKTERKKKIYAHSLRHRAKPQLHKTANKRRIKTKYGTTYLPGVL